LRVGAFPACSHSANWGRMSSGRLGLPLIVIVALMVIRRI
jgi:Protein of unknown function (DUF3309)